MSRNSSASMFSLSWPRATARGVAVALALLPLHACASDATGPSELLQSLPRELTASERAVIGSSNEFAFDLLKRVNQDDAADNVFISPLSVSMALGMTMNGAAGQTQDEMRSTLKFGDLSQPEINGAYRGLIDLLLDLDPSVDIGIANSVWYREGYPFDQPFFDTVDDAFDAEVAALDFSAPSSLTRINNWVKDGTRGRIPKIIDEIRADAVMYLINAIYFKGSWRQQFDPADTRDAQFTKLDGSTAQVRMMSASADVRAGWTPDYQVIDMPYGNGAFSMTILLPSPETNVNEVIEGLDAASWDALIVGLTQPRELPVALPKFKLEYEKVLNETLAALGMPTAFSDFADFSGMSAANGNDLSISEVKHKSFVEVNEEGTEAAAVTSVTIVETSMPVEFRVDRPFLFAIREQFSGTILFMGKIVLPEEG
jgi:serine protease inhibitor